jgi:hypothetical protein
MKKADVIEMLRDLPDELDPEEIIYRIYLKSKIDRAEAEVAAGNVIPHDEVFRILEEMGQQDG